MYLIHAGLPETFGRCAVDHPSMLAALGVLPEGYADGATMERTLARVMSNWNWETAWGWDFPLAAMTATRLGRPDTAIAALLHPSTRNRFLANSHSYQKDSLPTYLPSNGGLLTALAMMVTEGQGADGELSFPRELGWIVRAEGFNAWP